MARIIVHGMEYEAPDSFTLKEMRVIERYTDGHMTGDGYEIPKICATIHVAIMRAKPELPFEEIQAVVDDLPAEDLDGIFQAVDTAGQSPPAESNSESSGSSSATSDPPSELTPESESPESSGSQDLAGFRSFHATSRS